MLIVSLLIANDKHGDNDNYIFSADVVFFDNMAIILKDTSTGREAFMQMSKEDVIYLRSWFNSCPVGKPLCKEGDTN